MKKNILLLAVLAVSLIGIGTANAIDGYSSQEKISVTVETDPLGSPPWIKAKWELWLDPNTDDEFILTDADPARLGTQGDIVPGDGATFYSFVIVSDPNGIEDISDGNVYVDVYHPTCGYGDGSFKYQVHATEIKLVRDQLGIPDLDAPVFKGYSVRELVELGVATGYFSSEDASELLEELHQNEARIYAAELFIDYHQAYGWYMVKAWATDNNGATSEKFTNYFEVRPMLAYETDFNSVHFTNVKVGYRAQVSGDYDMNTSDRPTIRNIGNTPIAVSAYASDATSATDPPKKFEDVFDMRFLDEDLMLPSWEWTKFSNLLWPCNTTKIDFSLHLPNGAPATDYTGYILLEYQAVIVPCEPLDVVSDPVQVVPPT
ncbi:hypothetical protein [Geoglobus acetivorans]|uniref:Uncharacterized protein n=1 Tax=Geoglobus acetivorans TaxID=565033 RepID=A0A0A7GHW2_GEOAI|nr:hypothetical protein GACE_1510 [Geoglobus acetivorans]